MPYLKHFASAPAAESRRCRSLGWKSGPAALAEVPFRLTWITPATPEAPMTGALIIFWITSATFSDFVPPLRVFESTGTDSKMLACRVWEKLFMISDRLVLAVRAAREVAWLSGIAPTLLSDGG